MARIAGKQIRLLGTIAISYRETGLLQQQVCEAVSGTRRVENAGMWKPLAVKERPRSAEQVMHLETPLDDVFNSIQNRSQV